MSKLLESIVDSGFDPEIIRSIGEKLGEGRIQGNPKEISMEEGLKCLDTACESLPEEASKSIVALLFLETVYYKREVLANILEDVIKEKHFPILHHEANTETLVLVELWKFLTEKNNQLTVEDQKFVMRSLCVSDGIAWYAMRTAYDYMKIADITAALNLEAIRGEQGAFDDRLSSLARPFPGQINSAKNVRRLIKESQMVTDEGRYAYGYDTHPRVQDAICVRATPQTHGGARDMCSWGLDCLEEEIKEGSEFNFQIEYAIDALMTGMADLGNICERRTFRLNDSILSHGLPMNLVPSGTGINHGFPVVQSVQTTVLAELKLLSLPVSIVKAQGECGAYYGGCKLLTALSLFSKILAVELLMTCQGMDIVKNKLPGFKFGLGTKRVLETVRLRIALLEENRFVGPDMLEAERLVTTKKVLTVAQEAIGKLE